ncbi:boophilin-H2-like [Cherax quadricarinatus]|uniref:boophilin-H2-like n=1 Tax=Cherax quadricarinatus TaxID=27406 RepID=UPI002378A676|nr:boophilin-H2-like [Cherax quadricarinatus]
MDIFILLSTILSITTAFKGNSITDDSTDAAVNCHAPKDVGTCSGQQEAWYYSRDEHRCIFFVYSGCGGNANRFESRSSCEEHCQESRCPDLDCPDSCSRTLSTTGCLECACTRDEAKAVCSKQMKRGYCRALFHKWAWVPENGRCEHFVYGGCGGNENTFDTEEMCLRVCSGV